MEKPQPYRGHFIIDTRIYIVGGHFIIDTRMYTFSWHFIHVKMILECAYSGDTL